MYTVSVYADGLITARVAVTASKIALYRGETARLPGRTMMPWEIMVAFCVRV